jgi:integrase
VSKLTALVVKSAKPKDGKAYKLQDGGGMYLLVNKSGHRYWRYDYRYAGKRKTLALGVFPDISLAAARTAHQIARKQLGAGRDPGEVKKVERITRHLAAADSFELVAREWYGQYIADKSDSYRVRTLRILEKDLFPYLGSRPISSITPPELLAVLRRIEARDAVDMAHRAKQTSSLVFRYAVVTGRAERDPSQDITGALKSRKKKHHAAITDPAEVGALLLDIDGYQGRQVVKAALQISPLLFQRPGEIRHMEWAEINWDEARWEIPAEKMKMRLPHIVPLSSQVLELLERMKPISGHRSKYVFPSERGASRPLSENGVRVALRTLGYGNDQMTPHGFRAMARTILDEVLGYRVEWIEAQLAHSVRDANGRAYNRTTYLNDRRAMMQAWADYLDTLRAQAAGRNVIAVPFGRKA